MTQEHPITPPPELVKQWAISSPIQHSDELWVYELFIARQASRWGADQELEACCQVLYARYDIPNCIDPKMAEDMREWLRAARRPKPPSLKAQAIAALTEEQAEMSMVNYKTIRTALDSLPS